MQYSLRCNKFRGYAQNIQRTHRNHDQPFSRTMKTFFIPIQHQKKQVMITPQRTKQSEKSRNAEQQIQKFRSAIADPESDKITHHTDLTKTLDFKNTRPQRFLSTPKQNSSICMSESSASSTRRKSHFLTVVSRLPGMSKNKKINFS